MTDETQANETRANNDEEQVSEETVEGSAPQADAGKTPEDIIAELKDKLLREMAESENVRRRAERQISDATSYAIANFAREMLAVSDNLRRALDTLGEDAKAGEEMKAFIEGVEMTEREMLNTFERQGIRKIVPQGEKFDHNFHQAMFEVENTGAVPGTIVQVIQPGYVLKERLLRPAMVGIAKGPAGGTSEGVDEIV